MQFFFFFSELVQIWKVLLKLLILTIPSVLGWLWILLISIRWLIINLSGAGEGGFHHDKPFVDPFLENLRRQQVLLRKQREEERNKLIVVMEPGYHHHQSHYKEEVNPYAYLKDLKNLKEPFDFGYGLGMEESYHNYLDVEKSFNVDKVVVVLSRKKKMFENGGAQFRRVPEGM